MTLKVIYMLLLEKVVAPEESAEEVVAITIQIYIANFGIISSFVLEPHNVVEFT